MNLDARKNSNQTTFLINHVHYPCCAFMSHLSFQHCNNKIYAMDTSIYSYTCIWWTIMIYNSVAHVNREFILMILIFHSKKDTMEHKIWMHPCDHAIWTKLHVEYMIKQHTVRGGNVLAQHSKASKMHDHNKFQN